MSRRLFSEEPLRQANVPTVQLELRERLGLLQQLADMLVQPRLSPPVAGRGLSARRVRFPGRFEQRTRRRGVEGGIVLRREAESTRRHPISVVFSNECS